MTEVALPPTYHSAASTKQVSITLQDVPSPTSDSGVILASEAATPTQEQRGAGEDVSTDEDTPAPAHPQPQARAGDTEAMNGLVHNGPDEVLPADNLNSWKRDQPVKLRLSDKGQISNQKPVSVPTVFRHTVKKYPNHVALAVKSGKEWKKWSYRQYYDDVMRAARALIKVGLEPYHGVGIIGFNSPEWFISDVAAIFAGGFAVGIYTTNSPEACHYVAENADCNVIVVENDAQLQKILKVRDRLPHLKSIVQYHGKPKEQDPSIYSWQQFMDAGREVPESAVEERLRQMAPNKCCTLIYTSGTTGSPKGVMISHDNLTWTSLSVGKSARLTMGEEVLLSYLPLSHVAAQMIDIHIPIMFAGAVYFAQPDALKGSLGETLREVRPTAFFGVPRVWEKMQEKMVEAGKKSSSLRRKIAAWARDIGLRGNLSKMNGGALPAGWGIANAMVFKKVRGILGFDRCKFMLTGAAPITRDTLDFFMSLNMPLMELYGMSESSGPHSVSFPWRYRTGSVGPEMLDATTKLADVDKDGNGEICMGGRHVFMGYLNMEEKTIETMDDEGWLHSGDVGKKDKDGFLYITGRIKELIITAGGENLAPVPIEDIIKEELPCVANAMLIGDKRKFLSVLITIKTEMDADTGAPKDTLAPATLDWCRALGTSPRYLSDILDTKDEVILKAIQSGIDRTNARSVSRAQKIQKWSILPRDFSIPGGELGPTLKLKRPVVHNMYQNTINAFYVE